MFHVEQSPVVGAVKWSAEYQTHRIPHHDDSHHDDACFTWNATLLFVDHKRRQD